MRITLLTLICSSFKLIQSLCPSKEKCTIPLATCSLPFNEACLYVTNLSSQVSKALMKQRKQRRWEEGWIEGMRAIKACRQEGVLLNLQCPQDRITNLEGNSKSVQCVEPYGQCHSQSAKQRTWGAALWIRKLLLQYRWIISSLTGLSWDLGRIFWGVKIGLWMCVWSNLISISL